MKNGLNTYIENYHIQIDNIIRQFDYPTNIGHLLYLIIPYKREWQQWSSVWRQPEGRPSAISLTAYGGQSHEGCAPWNGWHCPCDGDDDGDDDVPQPWHLYFKMLYNSEVSEMRMLVALNHSVVMLPTLEFWAFTLLGSTYTMSFCCR